MSYPIATGRPYVLPFDYCASEDRDGRNPVLAVQDHGIAGIIAACDDDRQVDLAVESTAALYPALVCKTSPDAMGGVTIPVIQN